MNINFWWVNQGKTYHQEVTGGYMWSPKRKANGSKNHFYDNMTIVKPGDIVFSYSKGAIRAIGVAIDQASEKKKPQELDSAENNWNDEGWFVPVYYRELDIVFHPKNHLDVIARLLPDKYSPVQKNGNGNQGAYLSSIGEKLAYTIVDIINANSILNEMRLIGSGYRKEYELDLIEDSINNNDNIPETEKKQIIKARRGQGCFRSNVEQIEGRCRVTNIEIKEHLIAGHIKPWRDCNNKERLDGNNGFLLAPHIDHLFDRGYISFGDEGNLLVSSQLDPKVLESWGIDQKTNVGSFNDAQKKYLQYHRENIFDKATLPDLPSKS